MIRQSQLFLTTLREDPAEAEVASHTLMLRAGLVRRAGSGLFSWLPLGLRVRRNVERIVREEMEAIGGQEVLFPGLLPREPYERTGRWEEYGDGIFRLQDRKGADHLLGPTHEEMFTLLVQDLVSSYKQLPLTLFQIQDKYRDEARPRAGLLRAREFSMKDAYSFDVDDAGLEASYQAQRDAYERIFQRLGLDYVIVAADAGAMGGSKSEEFLHPTPVGEDTIVRSAGGYAANVEAFTTVPPAALPIDGQAPASIRATPDTPTIETLVAHANEHHPREDGRPWTAADTLKNVVLRLTQPDGSTELVVIGLPGDREVHDKRVEVAFQPAEVVPATEEDFAKHPGLVKGYIGPWSEAGAVLGEASTTGIRFLLDPRVVDGTAWLTGANLAGHHVFGLIAGRDFVGDGWVEAADVRAGDEAPDGSGPVTLERGMEVGHVFQLGRKYAEALGLKVLDQNGKLVVPTMGSYGIGVTRNLAAIVERYHDEKGIVWPREVAPFDVHVVATGKDEAVFAIADRVAADVEALGLEVLYDDRRKVSPGVKFGDVELLGMPTAVVVGRDAPEGLVEVWDRATGERQQVRIEELAAALAR
ncbi:proline--tRNA ligase [Agrococcus terreus]|uniref:Proline--tRNA ligase n=1 Tax=Agrococcus terreus TaxID=574649 RepID=A0ABQ2KME1_9MICO|nr:proline--tRNA ligase [Agrococcus terreus]GGN86536.1 proline--tRNA ligase [Agrococcus terreus]